MRKLRKFFSLVPLMILWLFVSVFLWGSVSARLTDTSPEHKLTLYVDAPVPRDTALSVLLEEHTGPGIRMVHARPFTYAMFDARALMHADLYIVRASNVTLYRDWFRPLPEGLAADGCLMLDGTAWGIPVYLPGERSPIAGDYIDYTADGAEEPYYLLFGAATVHLAGLENAVDDEAYTAAQTLLSLRAQP